MLKRLSVLFVFLSFLSLIFSQDSLHIRRRGSWTCPTDDLSGYGIVMHRILDHYIVVGRGYAEAECGDSLWFLDISNPDSPYVARVYVDTISGDSIGYLRWFEVCKDSGYIYVGYGRYAIHGGEYIRVLKVEEKGDTLSVEKRFFVDSVLFTSANSSYIVQDSFIWGGGFWNTRLSDTLVPVNHYVVVEGYRYPPDGDPEDWYYIRDVFVKDSFDVNSGEIGSPYPDSLEPAAFVRIGKLKFYSGDACTLTTLGCWRTEYDGELGQAVAISESLGVVMLGTWGGWHPGLYFVRLSDIEAGDYTAEPILKLDGSVIDLWVEDDTLLYVHKLVGFYILNIAYLPEVDTLAYYLNSLQSEILVEGRYIYAMMQTGRVFNIFEVDSTLGIQGKLEEEKGLEIYPNPIVFGSKLCLRGLDEVRGEVIDIRGEVVKRIEGNEVYVGDMKQGLYFLRVYSGGRRVVKKIVVM